MNDPWKDRLSEHVDGELSAEEARALEQHLASCASCREALADLRRIVERARSLQERAPARELWHEIEARLEPRGQVSSPRGGAWKVLAIALAAMLVAALGTIWFLREEKAVAPVESKLARYLMLLHEPAGHMAGATSDEIASVVDEYRRWAQGIAQSGHLLSGEKLTDGRGWILRPDADEISVAGWRGSSSIGGFFLIAAANDDEAREIARTCPHLRHDGWVELRPIEDTSAPRHER